jgi:hypothetical protein
MRTGNLLLDKSQLPDGDLVFDPRYGQTGGEDLDFFSRMLRDGRVFVWCDEAVVFEEASLERQTMPYYFKRATARGVATAR